MNRGKWKRCRNPYGTPPRYDYLDPYYSFPTNEYDNSQTHVKAKEATPPISQKRIYSKTYLGGRESLTSYGSHIDQVSIPSEDSTISNNVSLLKDSQSEMHSIWTGSHTAHQDENDERQREFVQNIISSDFEVAEKKHHINAEHNSNYRTSLVDETLINAFKISSKVCNVRDAQTQTQSHFFAKGSLTLTLNTKSMFPGYLTNQHHGEIDAPLQSGKITIETECTEGNQCYFPTANKLKLRSKSPEAPEEDSSP